MKIQGIIPPVVTPMSLDEEIDFIKLRAMIDHQIACGVNGIFVAGTTGECYALDVNEKQKLFAETVAHVNKRVPVFAGTGAETTRETIAITKIAERENVDGVSVITPYFIMPNQIEIAGHYLRVAESTSLPVVLYSNPSTCGGLKIEPETIAKLSRVRNIVAVKDSSGDMQNLLETIRLCPPDFSVLLGRDTLILAGLIFGAKGAIPASCNIAPKLCVEIYQAYLANDINRAKVAQEKLSPVRIALMMGTTPGVVKQAMQLIGRDMGPSRGPIQPLTEEKRTQLKGILSASGLI